MLQLELNLWQQIKEAEASPTAIAFHQLYLYFDQELERMSPKEKLEQGAEAIRQLADLLAMMLMRQKTVKAFHTYSHRVRYQAAKAAFWDQQGITERKVRSLEEMLKGA